jgi:acetyl esterase/lipase
LFLLAVSLVLFLLSLLVWFRAPTYRLWLVAIVVTEFFWIPLLVSAGLLVCIFHQNTGLGLPAIFTGLAGISFLMPFAAAMLRAPRIRWQLAACFKFDEAVTMLPSPYSLAGMLKGLPRQEFSPARMEYKKNTEGPLSLDFYPSIAAGLSPLVIVVHGGSWMSGNSSQLPDLNHYLAAAGYHVAALNYGLAPQHHYPEQVTDIQDGVRYLVAEKDHLRIDPSRLILLGRSAGGQIALMAAFGHNSIPGLRGVIDFYAPADMVWGATSRSNKWVLDTGKIFFNYLGAPYAEAPERYVAASPCAQVKAGAPPTLLVHGRLDSLVSFEHTKRLNRLLAEKGVAHYLLSLPFSTHGFDYSLRGPGGQASLYVVERFLQAVCR